VEKFRGLLGPKGMDPEAIAFWERAIQEVLRKPSYQMYLRSVYQVPGYLDHVQFKAYLDRTNMNLRRYLKSIGLLQ
jgi:tripartite-type tricarboxylate transporter receptor subunit TctC